MACQAWATSLKRWWEISWNWLVPSSILTWVKLENLWNRSYKIQSNWAGKFCHHVYSLAYFSPLLCIGSVRGYSGDAHTTRDESKHIATIAKRLTGDTVFAYRHFRKEVSTSDGRMTSVYNVRSIRFYAILHRLCEVAAGHSYIFCPVLFCRRFCNWHQPSISDEAIDYLLSI